MVDKWNFVPIPFWWQFGGSRSEPRSQDEPWRYPLQCRDDLIAEPLALAMQLSEGAVRCPRHRITGRKVFVYDLWLGHNVAISRVILSMP